MAYDCMCIVPVMCILASVCVAGACLKLNPCGFTVCQWPTKGITKATRTNINSDKKTKIDNMKMMKRMR